MTDVQSSYEALFDDGLHDMLTNSDGGGLLESVGRASVCGLGLNTAVPAFDLAGRVAVDSRSFGRTSVKVASFSDVRRGAMRSGVGGQGAEGATFVLLIIDADMPVSTMARAAITSTEAVTSVLQDLDVRDSGGRVCSGTPEFRIAVVRDRGSDLYLRSAGKHSKLGQLIGEAVRDTVRTSIVANELDPAKQSTLISRMGRIGFDEEALFRVSGCADRSAFCETLALQSENGTLVSAASAITFLADEVSWGLVPQEAGVSAGRAMLESLLKVECPEGDDLRELLAQCISMRLAVMAGEERPEGANC